MDFLVSRPLVSHSVVAVVMSVAFVALFYYCGIPFFGWLTFVIVSAYFYGRESGQNEHDCIQKEGYSSSAAFFGNLLPILFHGSNWSQFALPTIVTGVISVTAQYYLPGWLASYPIPSIW
jgi:ABC-type antimicrobial peptide transport system permease subunit